jgi:hypothetical protein
MTDEVDPRTAAQSLRRIDEKVQKAGLAGSVLLWYKGAERYFDVFFEIDADGCLVWFQLTFRGRALTWDGPGNRLWTGITSERALGMGQPSTHLVQPTTERDEQLVRFSLAVLESRRDEEPFTQALSALSHTA